MTILNESRYPTGEVERLVREGVGGDGPRQLAVRVVNAPKGVGYSGRAYPHMPARHPFGAGFEFLVKLCVGAPKDYPCDNMVEKARYKVLIPWTAEAAYRSRKRLVPEAAAGAERIEWYRGAPGQRELRLVEKTLSEHPYGGVNAPLIRMADWREALVYIAAHEYGHIEQFIAMRGTSEAECERRAAACLSRFRERKG